jgi:hypothetical protein
MANSPCHALLRGNGTDALEGTCEGRRNGGLHADFDSFKGTKTDIGDEFGGGRTSEVNRSLVLDRIVLAGKHRVQVLEVLIEAIFRGSLH